MSLFHERVYAKLLEVPKGKITTYKELAQALNTNAYRAVGTAMSKNPHAPKIPCHRVVNHDGRIGEYSGEGGSEKKIQLLKKEGIKIENKRIIQLKKYKHEYKKETKH